MAGNWKMNLDHLQATHLVQKLDWTLRDAKHDYDAVEVAVIPPFTDLRSVQTLVEGDRLRLRYGAQDLSPHASGAYTGASPALRGMAAYYGTFDNEVLMVNLKDHTVGWRYQHPERKFPFYSSAALFMDKVVLGGRDKMVHGLNVTGKEVWTFATRARVESSPAIAGGRVFVGSNDGRFYVLNVTSGAKLWEFNAGAPLSASPAIANGRIVIGAQDGRLYCFG